MRKKERSIDRKHRSVTGVCRSLVDHAKNYCALGCRRPRKKLECNASSGRCCPRVGNCYRQEHLDKLSKSMCHTGRQFQWAGKLRSCAAVGMPHGAPPSAVCSWSRVIQSAGQSGPVKVSEPTVETDSNFLTPATDDFGNKGSFRHLNSLTEYSLTCPCMCDT